MVIDAARGIEAQTRKLFEVCRLRNVPIITFVNKVDREGREPFDLLDEIADVLQLDVCPMSWPVGMGGTFEGIYEFSRNRLYRPAKNDSGHFEGETADFAGMDDPKLAQTISDEGLAKLREEGSLAVAAYPEFDADAYLAGDLTPVFFGSALKEFGVAELIASLSSFAPSPKPQPTTAGPVDPDHKAVSGFVFKVQANMNPQHRDRVAFMRLCSGRFKRGMKLLQPSTGKQIAGALADPVLRPEPRTRRRGLSRATSSASQSRDAAGRRHADRGRGDPLHRPAQLRAGDPAPRRAGRSDQDKAAAQGARRHGRGGRDAGLLPSIGANWIVGVVGQLQLDVLISRLEVEYKVDAGSRPRPGTRRAGWRRTIRRLKAFVESHRSATANDRDGARCSWPRICGS
jgi:peptide chain release factor 3